MRRILTYCKQLLVLASVFVFVACGGGGGGDSSSSKSGETVEPASVATLIGVVADGYLNKAQVFLDRNRNRVYDNGEPLALSGQGGVFTLEVNPGEGDLYPVVAVVVAGQTEDEDDGSIIMTDYILEAPAGRWDFISPLTTLVHQEMEKNPSYSEPQAEALVRTSLGIAGTISLFADYIDGAENDLSGAAEYIRAHQAARTVAILMGALRAAVQQNLGGQISDFDQNLVAYMVSDQILAQAQQIELALADERAGGSAINSETLAALVAASIDMTQLDTDLLDRYDQRLAQGLETWDMQAPEIIEQSPPAADTASVDVIVETVFNETLDAETISTTALSLMGPSGEVSGSLEYDAEMNKLTFIPDAFLIANSDYQVIVDGALSDLLGNPIGDDIVWNFSTIFDQVPPDLPEF
jgi:hypothetical protein